MKVLVVIGLILSSLVSFEALATVKPSPAELASYSTLIVVAQIESISKPYINQSVVTLQVKDVLHGHQPQLPIILTVLDNSMIVKGSLDFSAIQHTGQDYVYYLKYSTGEYQLADSWFGVTPASEGLVSTIRGLE